MAPGRALTPAPLRTPIAIQYGRGRLINLTPIAHIRRLFNWGQFLFG